MTCCFARPPEEVAKDDFERLLRRNQVEVTDAVRSMARGVVRGENITGSVQRFATVLGQTMTIADLLGRRRLLIERDRAAEKASREERIHAAFAQDVIPHVPFDEAIRDIVAREPRLAKGAEAVAELYQTEHAFAMALSTRKIVTEKAQSIIARALSAGLGEPTASAMIAELDENFAPWYGDVVYRTNLNTAYTAGRFAEARDPDVAEVIGAMERYAVLDSDARRGRPVDRGENHVAAHGLIAAVDDQIWEFASTPSGYG